MFPVYSVVAIENAQFPKTSMDQVAIFLVLQIYSEHQI